MRVLAWMAVLLFVPVVAAQDGPRTEDADFASWDGTLLKTRTYLPPPSMPGPYPAILITHGWPGTHLDAAIVRHGERLAEKGYLVHTWTARGFGASGGQTHLNGPEEVKDVIALVDALAARSDVQRDKPGDPRVGMTGVSYGGGIQILAAMADARIDSIVPVTTWSNLKESLAPQDVLKRVWVSLLYGAGTAETYGVPTSGATPSPNQGGTMMEINEWFAQAMATNEVPQELKDALAARSFVPGTLTAPTFLIQGWPDTLFPPSEALRTYADLVQRDVPARLWLTHTGHGGFYDLAGPYQAAMDEAIDAWFEHTLRGGEMTWTYPIERHHYASGARVGEYAWPPPGTQAEIWYLHEDTLSTGKPEEDIPVDLVATGESTTCSEVSNFQSQASFCPRYDPASAALWLSPEMTEERELTGSVLFDLPFESSQLLATRLFVAVVDVGPDGMLPLQRQVTPVQVPGDATVRIRMEPVTHTFGVGHRLGIQVATSDVSFSASREPGIVTVLTGPSHLARITVPWVVTSGDPHPPTAVLFVDPALADGNRTLRGIRVEAADNWVVENITVTAGPYRVLRGDEAFTNGANITQSGLAYEVRSPRVDAGFVVEETAPGPYVVEVTVTDRAGNEQVLRRNITSAFVEAQPVTMEKKSPLPAVVGVAAVVAVAFTLRGRQW